MATVVVKYRQYREMEVELPDSALSNPESARQAAQEVLHEMYPGGELEVWAVDDAESLETYYEK